MHIHVHIHTHTYRHVHIHKHIQKHVHTQTYRHTDVHTIQPWTARALGCTCRRQIAMGEPKTLQEALGYGAQAGPGAPRESHFKGGCLKGGWYGVHDRGVKNEEGFVRLFRRLLGCQSGRTKESLAGAMGSSTPYELVGGVCRKLNVKLSHNDIRLGCLSCGASHRGFEPFGLFNTECFLGVPGSPSSTIFLGSQELEPEMDLIPFPKAISAQMRFQTSSCRALKEIRKQTFHGSQNLNSDLWV